MKTVHALPLASLLISILSCSAGAENAPAATRDWAAILGPAQAPKVDANANLRDVLGKVTWGRDPATDFISFPGGSKKFAIRFDPQSKLYWSLANIVPDPDRAPNPGAIRNTLALICSTDLTHWTTRTILLHHPDRKKHAFQYVDWLFDGADIIAVSRTAFDDGLGGAESAHNANFLTFHRITNFREKTMGDSVGAPGK